MPITWITEKRKLGELEPQSDNPRFIDDQQAGRLRESWTDYGQVETLAISPGGLIYNGHQRYAILLAQYGPDFEVDVRVASRALSKPEWRKLTVLLHDGTVGNWDIEKMVGWDVAPDDLGDWGLDADMLELLEAELAKLNLSGESPVDPGPDIDRAAELQKKWKVKTGQVWEIPSLVLPGHVHRLVCGDCTMGDMISLVMNGQLASLVFTDPPFNVSYQKNESIASLRARNRRTDGLTMDNDSLSDDEYDQLLRESFALFPLTPGGVFYICAPPGHPEGQFRTAIEMAPGLDLRQCIVWIKDRFVFGRQDYQWRHESILYGWKAGAAHYFVDDRTLDTVWEIPRPGRSEEHPVIKPLELPTRAILNSSKPGDIVFDGFLGSGTTIVACEQNGRIGCTIELEPKYCAVSLDRLERMGLAPHLVR